MFQATIRPRAILAGAVALMLTGCFFMDIDPRTIPKVPRASITAVADDRPTSRFEPGQQVKLAASATYIGDPLQVKWRASRGTITTTKVEPYQTYGVWTDGGAEAGKPGLVEVTAEVSGPKGTQKTTGYLEIQANGEIVYDDNRPSPTPSASPS